MCFFFSFYCRKFIHMSALLQVSIISPFADWYFHVYLIEVGGLGSVQILLLSLLNGYIAIRMYQKTLAAVYVNNSKETVG